MLKINPSDNKHTQNKKRKKMNTGKVYGLFYKDHGNWRVANTNTYTLQSARSTKSRIAKSRKSQVIIRKVKFI